MKTLLSILLFFTCFSAFSQNPISTPRVRMPDRSGVDTTTIANTGQIVFDADDDKFRFNDGTGWYSFLKEGATLPYWPFTGTGDLTGNVTIRGDEHTVNILVRPALGGVLSIGNSVTGTVPTTNFIRFNSSGATVTGALNYSSEPTYTSLSMIAKNYADTHLGGATLPLASEGSENNFIVRGETNFSYIDPAGSGLTNDAGRLDVRGNVSVPVAWTWDNTGTRPSFTVGQSEIDSGLPFDSVAMYTKDNGFTFEVAGSSDIKKIIFKSDSGFVYHIGAGEVNPPVMYYASDYSGSSRFTDRALVDKGYVDGKVLEASGGWPLSGTASLTDDVEITSEDSLKLSPQVLMTPGQFSFVWDTTTVANNSSEVLTKDFFENFAEGMTSGYKVTAVIKITCIGVGFTQALGYYAGEKVYTVRRNYNGALTIIDSETIYQHNADEQPVDHILTVNGTGDSDDVLDLTISIGAVSNGMQFVTRVEVIYHAVYYEI